MRFLHAECLSADPGHSHIIRVTPSSSPRDSPRAIIIGEVCRERILTGDDVVIARKAKIFPD